MTRAIAALQDTPVEIRTVDRTVQEAEVPLHFSPADVVLVTHRRHVGSSGNLVFAAAAGLPGIANDEGLIGALVSAHELGTRVDSGDPHSIAGTIERLVSGGAEAEGFSPSRAREFTRRNSPRGFAEVLLETIVTNKLSPTNRMPAPIPARESKRFQLGHVVAQPSAAPTESLGRPVFRSSTGKLTDGLSSYPD